MVPPDDELLTQHLRLVLSEIRSVKEQVRQDVQEADAPRKTSTGWPACKAWLRRHLGLAFLSAVGWCARQALKAARTVRGSAPLADTGRPFRNSGAADARPGP